MMSERSASSDARVVRIEELAAAEEATPESNAAVVRNPDPERVLKVHRELDPVHSHEGR